MSTPLTHRIHASLREQAISLREQATELDDLAAELERDAGATAAGAIAPEAPPVPEPEPTPAAQNVPEVAGERTVPSDPDAPSSVAGTPPAGDQAP